MWSAMESYLRQPVAGKFAVPSSLYLSAIANSITGAFSFRKLVRKGVPPALRPQVWLSVSGAVKKRFTVLESNYEDLTTAVDGQITPATRQMDYVSKFFFFIPFFLQSYFKF